ncbi:MAG TPA: hypothetical protein PKD26_10110 [Pyrinomonadaceae bacterium]|nr:hypothetical protein [Pyrinomonadaceae bacterium]
MTVRFISRSDALNGLLPCAGYLTESIQSNEGKAQAMLSVLPAYLEKGEVDLAAELANTVEDHFVRDRLLINVAEKCASIGDEDYAMQLADAIDDPAMRAQAHETIGLKLASLEKFDAAQTLADSMEHRDNLLAGIAVQQHLSGASDAAKLTMAEIGYPPAATQAYLAIAAGEIDSDDHAAAVQHLEEALVRSEEIEHEEERIRTVIDVGNSFAAAGRNDRAIETLDSAKELAERLDNVHRDNFLSSISIGLFRAGSIDLADRTLDLVADKTQIANALLGFSREYWKKNEREDALDALEESNAILRSQTEKETRDSRVRYTLLQNIAVQFAGFERGERAIELAQSIDHEEPSMNALAQIANILIYQKDAESARTALNAIAEDAQRAFALTAMADTVSGENDPETAADLLDEALALAEEVPQLPSRATVYSGLSTRFFRLGHADKALEAATAALDTAAAIKDESGRVAALAELAGVFEANGFELNERHKEVIQQMLQPGQF